MKNLLFDGFQWLLLFLIFLFLASTSFAAGLPVTPYAPSGLLADPGWTRVLGTPNCNSAISTFAGSPWSVSGPSAGICTATYTNPVSHAISTQSILAGYSCPNYKGAPQIADVQHKCIVSQSCMVYESPFPAPQHNYTFQSVGGTNKCVPTLSEACPNGGSPSPSTGMCTSPTCVAPQVLDAQSATCVSVVNVDCAAQKTAVNSYLASTPPTYTPLSTSSVCSGGSGGGTGCVTTWQSYTNSQGQKSSAIVSVGGSCNNSISSTKIDKSVGAQTAAGDAAAAAALAAGKSTGAQNAARNAAISSIASGSGPAGATKAGQQAANNFDAGISPTGGNGNGNGIGPYSPGTGTGTGTGSASGVPAATTINVPDICVKNPNASACADLGTAPATPALPTGTVNVGATSFSSIAFAGGAVCPAPKVYTMSGRIFTYSYQPFCDFLGYFKPVALAVAMFIAGLIMFGQKSSD